MSLGTRFRNTPETHSSLRTSVGATLIGVALVGGSFGMAMAQDSTPEASPEASPVAVADWIDEIMAHDMATVEGDTTAVTVAINDDGTAPVVINAAAFETRPFVLLPTFNANDYEVVAVVFEAPDEFDAAGFTLPEDAADLPEGVTPLASYAVAADTEVIAVFPDLAPGTYLIATSNGHALTFVVTEAVDLGVPDIFADDEAEATPD